MADSARPLLIYGAGGHGQVIAEAAAAAGVTVAGFVDDHPPSGSPTSAPIHTPRQVQPAGHLAIIGIGDNATRRRLQHALQEAGWSLACVIHPRAWVSPSVELGQGVFIGANAVVNAGAKLADGVIVNSGAVVEHHCQIGAFSHLAPNATLCGSARVGELALIGAGATVLPVVHIAARAVIGAGATVIRDVGEGITVGGTPAHPLRMDY